MQRHASATVHEQYREQVWPHLSWQRDRKVGPLRQSVHSPANPQDLKNGSRAVQSVALETPPHASPPQCSRLPVWPSSTTLATTAQRAAELGSWAKGGSLQKVLSLRFAGKAARECPPTSCCGTWDISPPHSSDGRRLEVVAEGLRVPTCFGCHRRLHAPRRWNTQEEGGRGGWSCAEGGKKKQRGHTP